ncbi:fibronectin type III domain-containing protein, partial [Motilibacter deserti]
PIAAQAVVAGTNFVTLAPGGDSLSGVSPRLIEPSLTIAGTPVPTESLTVAYTADQSVDSFTVTGPTTLPGFADPLGVEFGGATPSGATTRGITIRDGGLQDAGFAVTTPLRLTGLQLDTYYVTGDWVPASGSVPGYLRFAGRSLVQPTLPGSPRTPLQLDLTPGIEYRDGGVQRAGYTMIQRSWTAELGASLTVPGADLWLGGELVAMGGTTQPGDVFAIVQTPGGRIRGEFANARNGSIVTATNGRTYQVTYSLDAVMLLDSPQLTSPAAPTGVTATPGDGTATVTWTAPASDGGSQITGYVITPRDPDGNALPAVEAAADATSAPVGSLLNGTPYTFTVVAKNAQGTGIASAPSALVTPRTVPGVPTNVYTQRGDRTVAVHWWVPGTGGGTISKFLVRAYDADGRLAKTEEVLGFTDHGEVTGLTQGKAYTFTVSAVNEAGAGPASPATDPVTIAGYPEKPYDVTAVAGDRKARVTWTYPVDNDAAITRWVVATYDEVGNLVKITDVGGAAPSGTVTGLVNGERYRFGVWAVNPIGSSDRSELTTLATPVPPTAPGTPGDVRSTPGDGELTVSWSAPADDFAAAPVTGYVLDVYTNSELVRTVTVDDPAALSKTVTGLRNGTPYVVKVRATSTAGDGLGVLAAPATPRVTHVAPGAPTDVTAVAGNGEATVSWKAPAATGGAPLTGYTVVATPGGLATLVGPDATSVVVKGLANGTRYSFTVTASTAHGTSAASAPTAEAIPQAPAAIPAPTAPAPAPTAPAPAPTAAAPAPTAPAPAPAPAPTAPKPVPAVQVPPATAAATAKKGAVQVGCVAGEGTVRSCDITLVTTVKGKQVVIGRGKRTFGSADARGKVTVAVTLTAQGKQLAARPGGLQAQVVAAVTTSQDSRTTVLKAVTTVVPPRVLVADGDLAFAYGSAELTPAGKKLIASLRRELGPVKSVRCEGHTDSAGSAALNTRLGLARAKAVCAELKLGSDVKASAVSYGESRPKVSNATSPGRAANRRVEIWLGY